MCSISIGYKNWWYYGHLKTLGQMNRGILGTCGNQYFTGTYLSINTEIFIKKVTIIMSIAILVRRYGNMWALAIVRFMLYIATMRYFP